MWPHLGGTSRFEHFTTRHPAPPRARRSGLRRSSRFAGCERSETRTLPIQRILASGELRVGTTGDFPPLTMRDRDGRLFGLEIDLVQALASSMNLKVNFVELPFAELIPAVERGDVDLAIAGMTITPERNAARRVRGSVPHLRQHAAHAQTRAGRDGGPRAARRSEASRS